MSCVYLQEHAFATATREPTSDEWEILQGMMAGKIIASALPQFMKRICTITQCMWIHDEIIQRTEGELWVTLPRLTKMFNFNQTTRRLVADIHQSAKHQGWTDQRLAAMLSRVKAVAYNKDMHSIHFFFYTKGEAVQFEGMKIPFRTSKLTLLNPDTRMQRSANSMGLPTDAEDGLITERYQAHHRIRMLNAARVLNLLALVAYLQALTEDGLKSACPLDTYGPHAEGSVSWGIFCKTSTCPPQLEKVHRIDYVGHIILLLHRPEGGPPPCLNCAQPGHQATACKTPKEEWNATTLVVTAADVAPFAVARKPWTTMEELQQTFTSLGRSATSLTPVQSAEVQGTDSIQRIDEQDQPESPPSSATPAQSENPATPTQHDSGTAAPDPANESITKPKAAENLFQPPKNKQRNKNKAPAPKGQPDAPPAANTDSTTTPGSTRAANRFAELDDSDDEAEEKDEDATPVAGTESNTAPPVPGTLTIGKGKAATHDGLDEDEALDRAVQHAKVERVRQTLESMIADHARLIDHVATQNAVSRARPHVQSKATVDWVLEAIGGRLTATPPTGNCQYYAFIEALLQRDLKLQSDPTPMVDMAKLFKYGLLRAHQATSQADRANNNILAGLETAHDVPTDLPAAEQHQRITEFYTQVARSSSALSALLPQELWGHWDTARMAAKLLGRTVFMIAKSPDPSNCYLNAIRMQRTKSREIYAALLQPGVAGWLEMVDEECARSKKAPIVLHFANNHYNGVIFDRENPANVMPTKKLKTMKIDVLWRPVSASIPQTPQASSSRSRRAVLSSSVRLTEDDLLDFLQDDGWSEEEKMEIVSILVSGATNYRELLTFSNTGADSSAPENSSAAEEASESGPSEYVPSESESDDAESASSQLSTLASQGSAEYRHWADAMWSSVSEAWLSQENEHLPALTDHAGLRALIAKDPEVLLEVGRWCDNPLTLLEHLTKDAIKDWMAPKWVDLCVADYESLIEDIMDATDRPCLDDWMARVRAAETTVDKRRALRDSAMRKLLKKHVPSAFTGDTANRLLSHDYKEINATVLILDELFPELARTILSVAHWPGDLATARLTTAFQYVPAFRAVLEKATSNKSWAPFEQYYNNIGREYAEGPDRS